MQPNHQQITFWLGSYIHRMPYIVGIQDANTYSIINHQSGVHCIVYGSEGADSRIRTPQGSGHQRDYVQFKPPIMHCKAFEDNTGALEMTKLPKIHSRTKHLNINYHHFQEIDIVAITSENQMADMLTKLLSNVAFLHFGQSLLWIVNSLPVAQVRE